MFVKAKIVGGFFSFNLLGFAPISLHNLFNLPLKQQIVEVFPLRSTNKKWLKQNQ